MKLSTIKSQLAELELEPSRRLGQNFLHDQNLAAWIVAQLELSCDDHLVEIGPGLGALTEFALPRARSATLLEKDARLAGFLRNRFAADNVEILKIDALEYDVRELFPRMPVKVLGNLPYYITSPVLSRFASEPSPASRLVLTVQQEFARRLAAAPGTKDYGALTLVIQRQWRAKYLRTLAPTVFTPQPKVDSAVILLTPRADDELPTCDGDFFKKIVRQGFSQRRKQMRKLLPLSADNWNAAARQLNLSATARAEQLTLEQWITLTNMLSPLDAALAQQVHAERFDVVNERNEVIGSASRQEVHERKLLHRAVHIFVFNAAGELFMQKRSRWKDLHPGKWDSSAAGHVAAGQSYDETAPRELLEELGIESDVEAVVTVPASEKTGYEFIQLYRTKHEGPLKLARAEIECGSFFPLSVIREWIAARPHDFASGFLECFRAYCDEIS